MKDLAKNDAGVEFETDRSPRIVRRSTIEELYLKGGFEKEIHRKLTFCLLSSFYVFPYIWPCLVAHTRLPFNYSATPSMSSAYHGSEIRVEIVYKLCAKM